MPKFRIELEQNDLQSIFTLMGQGYNGLLARITDQLKAGPLPDPEAQQAQGPLPDPPKPNGADQQAPNG